jgi:hypothetical protein
MARSSGRYNFASPKSRFVGITDAPVSGMRPSFVSTALLALLGAGAVACGQSADHSSSANSADVKNTWDCGTSDVPGGEVAHCTQSALVIDDSIQMTEPCEGSVDNPEACTSYTCTAGQAGCPPVDTTTTTSTTSTGATSSSGGSTTDTTTTGTTGDATGSGTDTTYGVNPGGSTTKGNNGKANGHAAVVPAECSYVDTCSAGDDMSDAGGSSATDTTTGSSSSSSGSTTDSTATDCSKGGCAPGQTKKDTTTSSSSSSSSSGSTTSDSSASTSDSSSSSTSSTSPKHYKCAKDKDGNRVCEETTPSCVAGSHPASCGACVPDGESDDCVSPAEGGCWVTGGGFIEGPNLVTGAAEDGHDNFGGNAKPMKDGHVQGHWNHVDHGTGNHAKGVPSYIVCRHVDEPGPGGPGAKKGFIMNQVYFGGAAQWDAGSGWEDGYWFDVVAKDHGEPGSQPSPKNGFMVDTYHFTIRKQDDPTHLASGTVVYETKGGLVGGNIQMHPPNTGHPYTPDHLPTWVSYEP